MDSGTDDHDVIGLLEINVTPHAGPLFPAETSLKEP
jgi:hypothetical protein